MRSLLLGAAFAVIASACVPVAYVTPGGGKCIAKLGQQWVGRPATFENGKKVIVATKSATFRWAAPGKALTTDVDLNRVTVHYDASQTITKVVCG
jgi:hypothetical protein